MDVDPNEEPSFKSEVSSSFSSRAVASASSPPNGSVGSTSSASSSPAPRANTVEATEAVFEASSSEENASPFRSAFSNPECANAPATPDIQWSSDAPTVFSESSTAFPASSAPRLRPTAARAARPDSGSATHASHAAAFSWHSTTHGSAK